MENKQILGYATPKKGMEEVIGRMNLDPSRMYEIYGVISGGDSPGVLELKTECGNILPYCASFFDVEPADLLNY